MRAPTKADVFRFMQNLPHTAELVTREMERQARFTIDLVSKFRQGKEMLDALKQGRIKISIEPPERDDDRDWGNR